MRSGRLRPALVLALGVALVLPAAAAAAPAPPQVGFQGLYDEYQRLGFVFGCAHRESDLRSALSSIPADIAAYDPGFADALDPQTPVSAAGTIIAEDGSPGPANQRPLGTLPAPEQADTGIPAVLIVLASLLGIALLAAAALSLRPLRNRLGI